MGYQSERDSFMKAIGNTLSDYQTRTVLRLAATLHRLAEAQCNGDYPADNGQRTVDTCPFCALGWAPESMRAVPLASVPEEFRAPASSTGVPQPRGKYRICPDCYATRKVEDVLAKSPWLPMFSGDPRGFVVCLVPRGTDKGDYDTGRVRGVPVPVRWR